MALANAAEPKSDPVTRIDQFRKDDLPILIPPNPAPHLTDWLLEIGPTVSGAMGEAAIGWADMTAWERLTGIALLPWEARILRRMSGDFAGQRSRSRDPACPAPYDGESREEREVVRDKVSRQFEAMIRAVQAQKAADAPKKRN